jgi:hypothetical protein
MPALARALLAARVLLASLTASLVSMLLSDLPLP